MTDRQQMAIRLLTECRMYERRDRERFRVLRLMRECDPTLKLANWEDRRLSEMLHKYRRQHGRCPCLACCNAFVTSPHDRSLFEEREI